MSHTNPNNVYISGNKTDNQRLQKFSLIIKQIGCNITHELTKNTNLIIIDNLSNNISDEMWAVIGFGLSYNKEIWIVSDGETDLCNKSFIYFKSWNEVISELHN